jgi:hypothetical protein
MLCGTTHRTLKNKTRKETRLKFYKTMATPVLMYGSEIWVPTMKVQTRIQSTEMNFLRKTKGCRKLDHITNEMIRTELNICPVNDTIEQYRNFWFQHINRTQDTRLPSRALQYRPSGKRDIGRSKKIWRDAVLKRNRQMPNPWSEEEEENSNKV